MTPVTPPAHERAAVLDALAARIAQASPGHPVRVAVDGPDAAGKTTLADELAGCLTSTGRPVVRASADDMASPRARRYARGRDDPDGYRTATIDVDALRAALLDPCGPGGSRRIRRRWFDLARDRPLDEPWEPVAADAIVIVDGVFLGREPLRDAWDLRVFVTVPPEESLRRALARDVPTLGTPAEVQARYRARYLPAQARYRELDEAERTANVVIDNTDFGRPVLLRLG